MAQINRRPSAVRRAAIVDAPETFEPQQQMPPQMQLENMMDSFGPEGPPASFDPTTFEPSPDWKPSGAVPLPGAAAPAAPEDDNSMWTGLTKSGIRYDESAYGPWHHYGTEAGKKELAESRLPESDLTYRRDVLGKMRRLPTGYMGSPDDYEKARALERSRRG